MLVISLIYFAAIVLLRSVETKERVKILLATLHDIIRWPCQFYDTPLKVKVAFDLYIEVRPTLKDFLAHRYAQPIRYSISGATSVAKSLKIKEISTCCPSFKTMFEFFSSFSNFAFSYNSFQNTGQTSKALCIWNRAWTFEGSKRNLLKIIRANLYDA